MAGQEDTTADGKKERKKRSPNWKQNESFALIHLFEDYFDQFCSSMYNVRLVTTYF